MGKEIPLSSGESQALEPGPNGAQERVEFKDEFLVGDHQELSEEEKQRIRIKLEAQYLEQEKKEEFLIKMVEDEQKAFLAPAKEKLPVEKVEAGGGKGVIREIGKMPAAGKFLVGLGLAFAILAIEIGSAEARSRIKFKIPEIIINLPHPNQRDKPSDREYERARHDADKKIELAEEVYRLRCKVIEAEYEEKRKEILFKDRASRESEDDFRRRQNAALDRLYHWRQQEEEKAYRKLEDEKWRAEEQLRSIRR